MRFVSSADAGNHQSSVSPAILLQHTKDQSIKTDRMDIKARQSSSWITPTSLLYVQVGLAFILIRLVFYTYTAFDPDERESTSWFMTKFLLSLGFLFCLCLQSLS